MGKKPRTERQSPKPKKPQEWLPSPCCHTAEPTTETADRNDEKETAAQPTRYTRVDPLGAQFSVLGGLPAGNDELNQYSRYSTLEKLPALLL